MKERTTYLLVDGEEGVNPANILVTPDWIELPPLRASKETRITLSTSELPQSLQRLLQSVHELHIRWASTDQADTTPPFSSRISPGLHVFYTPLQDDQSKNITHSDDLCAEIKNVFGHGLRCGTTRDAFSQPELLSERFATTSAFQYYQQLPIVRSLADYICKNYCTQRPLCCNAAHKLRRASYLDFDFDVISQSVVVTAVWPPALFNELDGRHTSSNRLEVGILNREKSTDDEKISLGGFLTVVGDDSEPKATLFSFPSRHHQLPPLAPESLSFTTSFKRPTGLHPTLQLTFDKYTIEPPMPACALHAYLVLPSTLFIDRYQLFDPLFLQSQNLVALRSLSGETDLEAPDWVVEKWGSAALFELAVPDDLPTSPHKNWTVSIPTHLRYLPPPTAVNASRMYPEHLSDVTSEGGPGKRVTTIPYPTVFWACPADSGLKMSINPFDRINLGYDGLFGPKTLFWHVPPNAVQDDNGAQHLHVSLDVPVMNMSRTAWVETATGLAVLLGFAWVCWKLLLGTREQKTVATTDPRHGERADEKKKGI